MKHFLITLLSIIFCYTTTAQQRSGFGVHAGTNASGVYDATNGYYNDFETIAGYQLGLRYNLKIGPVGLCSELNWNTINYSDPSTYLNNTYTPGGEVNLTYLSIPVLLKVYLT